MTTWPNWVDLIVATLLLLKCYGGFHRGFLTELFRSLGAVVVTALTINYSGVVASWLQPWLRFDPVLVNVLVFWLLFLGLMFIRRRLLSLAAQAITWERIHWTTQGLGLVLGALQGLWWSGIILVALSSSGFIYLQQSVEERSVSGPWLLTISREYLEGLSDRFPGGAYRGPTLIPPLRE
ncbi:MAG: CvpA family protein [Candidatus Omnitrophica bacterium]|nr:CvpA family protein [Candidatus Omnitrophota bacterium]MBI3021390.1 CvpA family protein [Candidatus Omnitrophota bacterium]MBI3083046.1 CvpA family protein [Candidatus Omnitrophota bacterium]